MKAAKLKKKNNAKPDNTGKEFLLDINFDEILDSTMAAKHKSYRTIDSGSCFSSINTSKRSNQNKEKKKQKNILASSSEDENDQANTLNSRDLFAVAEVDQSEERSQGRNSHLINNFLDVELEEEPVRSPQKEDDSDSDEDQNDQKQTEENQILMEQINSWSIG